MRFGSRSKGFATALALVMSTSLSFATAANLMADDSIPAVAQSAPALNQLFSKQWVRLNSDESISGSLVQLADNDSVALAGLPVSLVRDGEVAYSAIADQSGSFKFANVKTGSYSLVTRTNESIAAFSLQVLDSRNTHLSSAVEVRVVRPAGLKVKEILRSQTLPLVSMRSESKAVMTDPLGDSRSFSKSQFVRLDASGKLVGQLGSVAAPANLGEMVVYVLRNGEEVARTKADNEGKFSFDGLRPGVYGFVAAGGAGFAATSFQLVSGSVGSDGSKLISSMADACGQMNVEVVQCCEVAVCEQPVQTVVETVVAQAPIADACAVPVDNCGMAPSCGCGGGFGGGFGGGGGGGFGGGLGGLGGIAAIAGLATVAGIIAANDDNDNAAVIVSPIR